MGGIWFRPTELADLLAETTGFKTGLALSFSELCDHLSGSRFPDLIRTSETSAVRLRSEEFDDLFYELMHRVGYTEERFDGDSTGLYLSHKYRATGQQETYYGVLALYIDMMPRAMEEASAQGKKLIDPRPFIQASHEKYGRLGVTIAVEKIEAIQRGVNLSPHSRQRFVEWSSTLQLTALFSGTNLAPEKGRFIDQRFVDYLSTNHGCLATMHWRKFEQLAAEFFHREGFQVELGPGGNDDGVDVRVWKPGLTIMTNPLCLIQCKRQKEKVERVVVKGLAADVSFEQAEYGLIVTTSELAPGSRSTINARGYPIREVNRESLSEWLATMRTPGTGIVRV